MLRMTKLTLMLGDGCFVGEEDDEDDDDDDDDDDEAGSHVLQEGEGCVALVMMMMMMMMLMMMMMMMKVTSERCRCPGEVSEVRKGWVRKRGENNVSTLVIGLLLLMQPNVT